MSETELLQRIYRHNAALLAQHRDIVTIGPGDDMASLKTRGRTLFVAVDQVVAGRHFISGTPMGLVARKAIARNISDVAAMAARPFACVAAATLPRELSMPEAAALYEGLGSAAEGFECPLVGGDTSVHAEPNAPLVCTVTVLADLPVGVPAGITRDGARLGDLLCVTGRLGGSFGADGLGRHLTFVPRVAEATALARTLDRRLHAMIDLSDGLGRDAAHLAHAANLSIEIDAAALPCTEGCTWRQALSDGEDYELCFASEGPPPMALCGTPVYVVGRFVEMRSDQPRVGVHSPDGLVDAASLGWEHRLG